MFTGLKSIIFPSSDLERDKKFWQSAAGVEPYADKPYYVGFNVGGIDLGLDPNAARQGLDFPVSYWNVKNAREAADQLVANGATVNTELKDVGGGMMMGTFKDPGGYIFGIIDNPAS